MVRVILQSIRTPEVGTVIALWVGASVHKDSGVFVDLDSAKDGHVVVTLQKAVVGAQYHSHPLVGGRVRHAREPHLSRFTFARSVSPLIFRTTFAMQSQTVERRSTILTRIFNQLQDTRVAIVRPAVVVTTGLIARANDVGIVLVVGVLCEVEDEHLALAGLIHEPALVRNASLASHHHVAFFARRERHLVVGERPRVGRTAELRFKHVAHKRTAVRFGAQTRNARVARWWHLQARATITITNVTNIIHRCSEWNATAI